MIYYIFNHSYLHLNLNETNKFRNQDQLFVTILSFLHFYNHRLTATVHRKYFFEKFVNNASEILEIIH